MCDFHMTQAACTKNVGDKNTYLIDSAYLTDFIREFSHVFLNTSNAKPLGVENATCLERNQNPSEEIARSSL